MNDKENLIRIIIASVTLSLPVFIISCAPAQEEEAVTMVAEGVKDLTEAEIAEYESEEYTPTGTSQV